MDEGLMGTVAKLPLERNFKLEHVKEVGVFLASAALRVLFKIAWRAAGYRAALPSHAEGATESEAKTTKY